MRSRLTRHVPRLLLAHPGTPLPSCSLVRRPAPRAFPIPARAARLQQRRHFINVFTKPPRTLRQVEVEPGYETLLQFRSAENDNVRPPARPLLVKAWRMFFRYKAQHKRPVNATQAMCAHRVLLHLVQPFGTPFQADSLTVEDLRLACESVQRSPREDPGCNLELYKELYVNIRTMVLRIERTEEVNHLSLELAYTNPANMESGPAGLDFSKLLATLSTLGEARAAHELLLSYYAKYPKVLHRDDIGWMAVIRGLAAEGHEKELLETVEQAEKRSAKKWLLQDIRSIMTSFYAKRDDFGGTKRWYNHRLYNDHPISRQSYYQILQFALRNGAEQKKWAMEVYEEMVERLERGTERGSKFLWDTTFQWAIMLLGKGPDHVEHMIEVNQAQLKGASPERLPDIETVNRLLQIAIDKKDPYLGERFFGLAERFGFEPNTNTYLLQMEYRLVARDFQGAFKTFEQIQPEDINAALPLLNSFIRDWCSISMPNYAAILDIAGFIEQNHALMDPETVVSLCMAFLKNDEHHEVIDTLSLHTVQYSVNERAKVRKAFVEYCLDMQNSTARVWDAYALLRQFFPEVENEDRIRIMDLFFDRHRPDMASHVFGHMRAHNNPMHRPTVEAYTKFFMGVGRWPDIESLRMVHNMLKMDTMVTPTTTLYNALMVAYASCDEPYEALDIWKDISSSPEGPSYQSLEIAFRTYEVTPSGDELARELWLKIRKMEIDVPVDVYAALVAAIAAHGNLDETKTLLSEMEGVVGSWPNVHTLAFAYNALVTQEDKNELGAFAKENFPPVWDNLTKKYKRRVVDGVKKFVKIQRPWKA